MENEIRKMVRDYINAELKEIEIMGMCNLKYCAVCRDAHLEEDLLDTEPMINGGIGYVCEDCLEDMRND